MIPGNPNAPTIKQFIKFKAIDMPKIPLKKLKIASKISPPKEFAISLKINDRDLPTIFAIRATKIIPVNQYNITILSPSSYNYIS